MARVIAIKEEYFASSDEATLSAVLKALNNEFLLLQLDNYRIEVNDMDYPAVTRALDEIRRDIELNSPR